ncbi:imm11 family protein [Thalassomonas actiniarum]|uniref:Immunity MXAN-0049 protein domain-containing protein n=1 Tax=Thalassomonas actiniarum TaxID=485447 RepID=A0AAE9YR79_9GAMM|nr:hypothetical protein [Thalassomonas actiniarum]WDD99600.1 hypothetical protein SG35_002685 [Thalassomonas actiniarum]
MAKFNKVYTVSVEPDEYLLLQETVFEQSVQLSEDDLLLFDGKEKGNDWRTLGVDWLMAPEDGALKKPDIAGLGSSVFCVSARTADLLSEGLKSACEFLPLNLNGEPWFALNILGAEEAIDEKLTQWNMRNGKVSRVRRFNRLVLDKQAIEHTGLFRVNRAGLFTFTTDAEGSLYDIVKQHHLTGLVFSEVDAV